MRFSAALSLPTFSGVENNLFAIRPASAGDIALAVLNMPLINGVMDQLATQLP
jgi:hypothetical protein